MEIAKEFDEKERKVMLESGVNSNDFLKFMAEDSGNLADDGNYSIQVIAKALEVWSIEPIPITNPEMIESRRDPLKETSFICNLASHWLTIRKLDNEWYNLNSLLSSPEYLSDFYLSAFLDTLIMKGYTVFCVRGDLPRIQVDYGALNDPVWKKKATRNSTKRPQQIQQGDKELEEALAASELEAAIQASLLPPSPKVQKPSSSSDNEDDELMAAIQMSQELAPPKVEAEETMEPEPPKGADISELVIRLPDGSRLERRFNKNTKLEVVYSFLKSKGISGKKLVSNYPRKEYSETSLTLEQAGLFPGIALIVQ